MVIGITLKLSKTDYFAETTYNKNLLYRINTSSSLLHIVHHRTCSMLTILISR